MRGKVRLQDATSVSMGMWENGLEDNEDGHDQVSILFGTHASVAEAFGAR